MPLLRTPDGPYLTDARWADWVELSALLFGNVSRAEVEQRVSLRLSVDTVQLFWALRMRAQDLPNYPLEVRDGLILRAKTIADAPAFALLALVDMASSYKKLSRLHDDAVLPRLFEYVTVASERGLTNGGLARRVGFGGKKERGRGVTLFPRTIVERLNDIANWFDLTVKPREEFVVEYFSKRKDLGVDVISRVRLLGNEDGTFVHLVQCKAGLNWERSDVRNDFDSNMRALMHELLVLDGTAVRAIAIPRRLEERVDRSARVLRDYKRASREYRALVLDRMRLLAGDPDRYLQEDDSLASERPAVIEWAEAAAARTLREAGE